MDRPQDHPHYQEQQQPQPQQQQRLALIELAEPAGRAQHALRSVDVWQWPVTIGRALDNTVVLDDPHVAPHHARLAANDSGNVVLTVLSSHNGVQHGKRRIASGQTLVLPDTGALMQLGATHLNLRLPAEVLTPEQPMRRMPAGGTAWALLAGVLLLALLFGTQWLGMDPGTDPSVWLPTLLGVPMALVLWIGLWALVSKVFSHRFDFGGHLRIALPWLLSISLVDLLWPQVAAAVDSPLMWQLGGAVQALLVALLVRAHLVQALPSHPRAIGAAVAALLLLGVTLTVVTTQRQTDRWFSAPYMSTLPLPATRLAPTVPTAALLQGMAPLQGALAARVQKARDEDEADSATTDGNEGGEDSE
ncbi:MAG: FHA domain-containing protein [Rubrivivax sp.]